MRDNWSDIITSGIIGNVLHLVLTFIYTLGNPQNPIINGAILAMILIMWLFIGFRFAYKIEKKSEVSLIFLGIVCIIPIVLYLIACQSLIGIGNLSDIQNYSLFYFIGMPTLFWNKPFLPIMNLFQESSIYIQLDINVVVVFFVVCLGGYIGFFVKKQLKRRAIK